MSKIQLFFLLLLCSIGAFAQTESSSIKQINSLHNIWSETPTRIPNNVAIDAPLMGNGDVTMSVGYKENKLRYYLSKNDFWRLRSQSDDLSGPRVVSFVDIQIDGFNESDFSAKQSIKNGLTTCLLNNSAQTIKSKSWVSATDNLLFIELEAIDKATKVSINLSVPENKRAEVKEGKAKGIHWLTRAFVDSVDIPTKVAVALKINNYKENNVTLEVGKKLVIAIAVESAFKQDDPLKYVVGKVAKTNNKATKKLFQQHNKWWNTYWSMSSISISDPVLMKAYYQGLYTMAACSRDLKFPPGIFGWTTTDRPRWNGDYHLNYNFEAPFYGLYAANRLEQGEPHDAPLIDFMAKGEAYAKQITHGRGVLYPVGIGPLGTDVTKNHPAHNNSKDTEEGGLFFGQRSNSAYGLINMAQYWRSTYDTDYGRKIYPYALAVVNFWEDYLRFENGRYVIYGDAIHEGSGEDKNPILSLGLLRNAFDLIIDLSTTLKVDEDQQEGWKNILSKLSDFPVQTRNGKKVFRYTEEGVAWWSGNGLGIQQIYPANAITLDSDQELLVVAQNTIDEMQRWHDSNTSSSFFTAAVRVGYNPQKIMTELRKYAQHTYPNGFQMNNPHGIENSCTVTNALNEMLCMSAGNVIRLFSVFPKDQNASFNNLRTWGAFLVSAKLNDGIINQVKIKSEKGMPCTIINPWPNKKVLLVRNGKKAETLEGDRITFPTNLNETIEVIQI